MTGPATPAPQTRNPDRRRRSRGVPRGRPRPAPPLRRATTGSCAPNRARRPRDAQGTQAARRHRRGVRRRLPDAADERHRVPRSRRWTSIPLARRVLLTAYADTHAAIDAINVVDLDHYLLKPWDPPEEKLYPVIDGLLEAWRAARRPRHPAHQGDRPPLERAVLGGARVPGPQPALVLHVVHGRRAQGRAAARSRRPRRPAAARRHHRDAARRSSNRPTPSWPTLLGLSTTPVAGVLRPRVIGGGPAGLAAAVYGASEGLQDGADRAHRRPAGRRARARGSRTISASPTGVSGSQLADVGPPAGREVRRRADHRPQGGQRSRSTGRRSAPIQFDDGGSIGAHAVILATGVDYRQLQAPGAGTTPTTELNYTAAASTTARPCPIASECEDEEVYIVGGANSAGQAAMYMSRTAKSVTMRGARAVAGGVDVHYLIQQIEARHRTSRVRTCTEVASAVGERRPPGPA